jgi:sigma-B regulation protein RsbQ
MALTLPASEVLARNHVQVGGAAAGRPLVFVHGFACDQRMWRHVTPHVAHDHPVVLFDQVGAGRSDVTAYDPVHHGRLEGYAQDLVEIAEALDLQDAVVVGHSVGASVAVLAHLAAPERFAALALVGPSARYVDDPSDGYVGGLSPEEVEELLRTIEANFLGWSNVMAPVIMGNAERPELGAELTDAFCSMDPDIAARWARVTFLGDIRDALPATTAPTLVLQCSQDPIVPDATGRWMADRLPDATFVQLQATGHCPHLSAPEETAQHVRDFAMRLPAGAPWRPPA